MGDEVGIDEIDELLGTGQAARAAELAAAAVEAHPELQTLWARLMIAFARSGRPVDAMRAFRRLQGELESEPSDWIVSLERAIALHDPVVLDVDATAGLIPAQAVRPSRLKVRRPLPQGVITFFMTDVVGSTRLWETTPRVMRQALARHDELIADAVETHDGVIVRERGEGDSTFSVFRRATDAAAAALTVQLYLAEEPWPPDCRIVVRSALHTGEASDRDGDYYGRVVNRTARLRAIADPGQILVSQSTAEVIIDHLPANCLLVSLGTQHLKDMDRAERVHLLVASEALPAEPSEPAAMADVRDAVEAAAGVEEVDEIEAVTGPVTPTRRARWEVEVGADRTYFEQNAAQATGVPNWDYRYLVAIGAPSTSIGRPSRSAGLVPDIDVSGISGDTSVSRAHAVLEWSEDGTLSVVDLDSTNGTYVNDLGEPIPSAEPYVLEVGDRIYLGAWTYLDVRRLDP